MMRLNLFVALACCYLFGTHGRGWYYPANPYWNPWFPRPCYYTRGPLTTTQLHRPPASASFGPWRTQTDRTFEQTRVYDVGQEPVFGVEQIPVSHEVAVSAGYTPVATTGGCGGVTCGACECNCSDGGSGGGNSTLIDLSQLIPLLETLLTNLLGNSGLDVPGLLEDLNNVLENVLSGVANQLPI